MVAPMPFAHTAVKLEALIGSNYKSTTERKVKERAFGGVREDLVSFSLKNCFEVSRRKLLEAGRLGTI